MIKKTRLWSQELDKMLLGYINNGQTFSVAAQGLGVTRSAAIGRFKRLTNPSTTTRAMVGAKTPRATVAPTQSQLKPVSLKLALVDLPANGCKYATSSHGLQHLFCGAPQQEKSAYCSYHKRRTTEPSKAKYR